MTSLAQWVFAVLCTLSPVRDTVEETAVERRSRYVAIAIDLAEAAPSKDDAALAIGIAWLESGFALDADVGPCRPGRCDQQKSGEQRASCLMQIQGPHELREELFRDRQACFRRGIAMARASMAKCGDLTAYASGACQIGRTASSKRLAAVRRIRAL